MADSATKDSYRFPSAGVRHQRPYRVIGEPAAETEQVQRAVRAATSEALDQEAGD